MKKVLSISLVSLLLVSTIGITVHKHYCDSTLIATSILPHGEGDHCGADMPMGHHSCEDQHDLYNVDSPLVIATVSFNLAPAVEWVKVFHANVTFSLPEATFTSNYYADISPPPSEPNIYTRVQAYLL